MLNRKLDEVSWAHRSGPFRALEHSFGVRSCDPALGRYVERILAPFATDGDVPIWYSVLDRNEVSSRRFRTYMGSRRLNSDADPRIALSYVLWSINQQAVASLEGYVVLHAAAAERDGATVLLPAQQEAGKTTLVTGLLRRGFRYVTDEAVVIDIATGRIRPFHKALGIDEGSWPLFPELAPDLDDDIRPWLRDQWHIPATATGAELSDGGTPRLIISPRYRSGCTTELQPLRRSEALALLSENAFNVAQWGQAGFDTAAAVVRGCRCARLAVGDLEAACDAVVSALDEALTRQTS